MMVKATSITFDDLCKKFIEYSVKTENLLYAHGYKFVWFDVRTYKQSLVFTRRYSTLKYDAVEDPIQAIKDWFDHLTATDRTYIQTEEFGNGIRFSGFEDIYGIMET